MLRYIIIAQNTVLYCPSLQQLVADLPSNVLTIAYDWVGEKIYFVGHEESGPVGMWRVPVINPAGVEEVLSCIDGDGCTLGDTAEVQLLVDPFRGYVFIQFIGTQV